MTTEMELVYFENLYAEATRLKMFAHAGYYKEKINELVEKISESKNIKKKSKSC